MSYAMLTVSSALRRQGSAFVFRRDAIGFAFGPRSEDVSGTVGMDQEQFDLIGTTMMFRLGRKDDSTAWFDTCWRV